MNNIHSGTNDPSPAPWEIRHREVARRAAAEGMVLLKNESLLPFRRGEAIALLGGGAGHTIKGGTGSGDVNERETVSVEAGLKEAGAELTSESWLRDFDKRYTEARLAWKQEVLNPAEGRDLFDNYASHPFQMPAGRPLSLGDVKGAAAAVYVISRVAGEGADRQLERGDYYLSERELEDLKWLDSQAIPTAVLLNTGAPVDLQEILALEWVRAVLLISQPGQEGGHAAADVLLGKVSPSGKLTDTWAAAFEDYPNAETFSHLSGDVEKEYYREGIYVGYRYFDSFGKKPLFPFGFGLSYTRFLITPADVRPDADGLAVSFRVINTGDLPGREVVQLYAACPQEGLPKEAQRLAAFIKTPLLSPGESWEGSVTVPSRHLASYDETRSAWILEKGRYGLWIGNSSRQTRPCGTAIVERDIVLEEDAPICPQQDWLLEIVRPEQAKELLREREQELKAAGVPEVVFTPRPEEHPIPFGDEVSREARRLASRIPAEELIPLLLGEFSLHNGVVGDSGIQVPGSAAETTRALWEEYGIVPVVLADGPAGLRLKKRYVVDRISGKAIEEGPLANMEGGFFVKEAPADMGTVWYQYATAFPIGTMLAQSFDTGLLEEVGRSVAEEMEAFHVSWWLAPGMNIHRNPLCGRNFEYYSEDPLVSGKMAAAITRGVQSLPGTGTTIKHFACNNQEDNRFGSDSVVSERALREIYLRGFEIAVKTSQPMCIMTSYNLINDVHTANSRDLCTEAARREWGFEGLIMTDWGTTAPGRGSSPRECIAAGNDLIMPGSPRDEEDLRQALAEGELTEDEIRECAARVLDIILRTNAYEDAVPYPKLRV